MRKLFLQKYNITKKQKKLQNQVDQKMLKKNSFQLKQSPIQQSPQKLSNPCQNKSKKSQLVTAKKESKYEGFSYEELIQKIQKQQNQIQKLTKIIDLYKCKISQFSQYQAVLQEYMHAKAQQKIRSEIEKQVKIPQFFQKNMRREIANVINVKIESKNQNSFEQQEKQLSSIKTQSSKFSSWSKQLGPKPQQIQKQIHIHNYFAPKFNPKDFYTQNMLLNQNKENSNFSQFLSANADKNKNIQRIPSLQNMRRMEKCFKLLNN